MKDELINKVVEQINIDMDSLKYFIIDEDYFHAVETLKYMEQGLNAIEGREIKELKDYLKEVGQQGDIYLRIANFFNQPGMFNRVKIKPAEGNQEARQTLNYQERL